MKTRFLLSAWSLLIAVGCLWTAPRTLAAWNLQETVGEAAATIHQFKQEGKIPQSVFDKAKGVAFLRMTKGGLVISGEYGHGLVVQRLANGWSGPSAISSSAVGIGAQIGGSETNYVFVLNSDGAIRRFSRGGKVQMVGEMSGVAGPESEHDVFLKPKRSVYVYRATQGLFGGIAFSGTDLREAPDTNERYYHRAVTAREILSGKVAPPHRAQTLINALNAPYPK
ncbi:lipid-binding SYLF domain-containing protein [Verrucomicrobium sp. 3C]|uniref:lipid-binding SYLF domain-containing protein n=1 Tax=Verrucomicrobium sp. 3C TaxID=1134055 RepID=UPI0003783108|nr:lipid-binding SYLF domain-containing protein [Verrucomicrobium sp. 3C]